MKPAPVRLGGLEPCLAIVRGAMQKTTRDELLQHVPRSVLVMAETLRNVVRSDGYLSRDPMQAVAERLGQLVRPDLGATRRFRAQL